MSDRTADDLLTVTPPPTRTVTRPTHPKGWEPGLTWNGKRGEVTSAPQADEPCWDELVADWGLDPAQVTVVPGSVQIRAWDTNLGSGEIARLRYYRATVVAKVEQDDRADVDELCAQIMRRKPAKRHPVDITDRAMVVALADWQAGKGEGDGTAGTVRRILASLDNLERRLRELRKIGRPVGTVYLIGMGDLIEQCRGHYDMQAFQVDLDRREQKRIVRRLILAHIDAILPHVDRIVLSGVPGNHGENRNAAGKAFTSWTDNDDLAVIDEVGDVLAANPDRYADVSVFVPDDLTMTLDVAGVPVAFAHGHQAGMNPGGSGHAAAKLEAWWRGQVMGRQSPADAQILVTGHLHHLIVSESTGRTFIQCPAQDPGSHWWTARTGQHSATGLLTFLAGEACGPRGWSDLAVL